MFVLVVVSGVAVPRVGLQLRAKLCFTLSFRLSLEFFALSFLMGFHFGSGARILGLGAAQRFEVQSVAEALAIHPFMLSRWRKQSRDGALVVKKKNVDPDVAAELKELRKLKRKYRLLEEEHEALKKFIAWEAEQKKKSSRSSTRQKKPSR